MTFKFPQWGNTTKKHPSTTQQAAHYPVRATYPAKKELSFLHPLYSMDENGVLKLKSTGKTLSQSDLAGNQEEILNAIIRYVHESMSKELGFREVFLPAHDAPVKVNVFVSPNYATCQKLLVFVSVSRGLVPGLWSRGLAIQTGIKSGSMLGYFRTAIAQGYGILVCNPNKNFAYSRDGSKRVPIPTSSTPEKHIDTVWDKLISPTKAKRIYFIGYSYGGVLVKYLLQSRGEQLMSRNGAIALIESSHRIEDTDSPHVKSILAHRTMYWECHDDVKFERTIEGDAPHRTGCTCLSAGRPPRAVTNHYHVAAFCLHQIRDVLFRFLEVRDAKAFVESESNRLANLPPGSNATRVLSIKVLSSSSSTSSSRSLQTQPLAVSSNSLPSEKHCNLCLFQFTLFDRRHHCRMCHRAVCNACSRDRLFLPRSSTAQRVCSACANNVSAGSSKGYYDVNNHQHRINRSASYVANNASNSAERLRTDTQLSNDFNASCDLNGITSSTSSSIARFNAKLAVEDFELLKVIGKGAFGKVMLVRKKNNNTTNSFSQAANGNTSDTSVGGEIYAMKVLKKAAVFAKNQVEHTKSERRILRDIDHPFVVRLRYAFQSDDKLYLVMDYYNGGSLFFHLRKSRKFSEKRARFYAAQLLLSMAHLHELNIAYRDLKLENILMDEKGFIALTDFGLSKENVDMPDGAKTFCGTAEYIAPELLKGLPYGKAVDWWGFGTLLYEMMTGQTPFFDRNRKRMFHNILHRDVVFTTAFSEEAKDVLIALLRRDPAKRLGSGPSGAQEIMDHPFFASIDFDKLFKREVEAPFKPNVTNDSDTTNVANIFTKEIARDSPVTQQLGATHRAQAHFEGFTYMPGSELHE